MKKACSKSWEHLAPGALATWLSAVSSSATAGPVVTACPAESAMLLPAFQAQPALRDWMVSSSACRWRDQSAQFLVWGLLWKRLEYRVLLEFQGRLLVRTGREFLVWR